MLLEIFLDKEFVLNKKIQQAMPLFGSLSVLQSDPEPYSGVLYRKFIPRRDTVLIEAAAFFSNSDKKKSFSGVVGKAFESYTQLYVCNNQYLFSEIKTRIIKPWISSSSDSDTVSKRLVNSSERLGNYYSSPKERSSLGICVSLLEFNSLQGMTSHRDYTYNRSVLATLVISGTLLFGSASERIAAYEPKHLSLLEEGDLVMLPAPPVCADRPYFWMTAPSTALISRLWLREAGHCPHCKSDRE